MCCVCHDMCHDNTKLCSKFALLHCIRQWNNCFLVWFLFSLSSGKWSVMNMALTPLAATMETMTCNWTASMFTTMKPLVGTSHLFSTGNIKYLLVKPGKYTYRHLISKQRSTKYKQTLMLEVCFLVVCFRGKVRPSCHPCGSRARNHGLCPLRSFWTDIQTWQLCFW